MKYFIAAVFGAILGLTGCEQTQNKNMSVGYYPAAGVTAYKGQSVSQVWENNGAPNVAKQLEDGKVLWVYYSNYRPVGGGEIISYDMPGITNNGSVYCSVEVMFTNDTVSNVRSDCE